MTNRTQGCPDQLPHVAHDWTAHTFRRNVTGEPRRCPGRVRCDRCDKAVFTTLAAREGGGWVCRGQCR